MRQTACRTLFLLLSPLLLQSPVGLEAQVSTPDPGIRVIAAFDPATDERTFSVLEPLSGGEILGVQEALAGVGVDPGARDGRLGPATRGALTQFQTARGLRACGCVTYETVVSLGLRARVVQTVIGPAPAPPDVEVIMPRGVPQPPAARVTGPSGAPPPTEAGAPAEQGPGGPPTPPPGYRAPGIWIPVFPYAPSILDPIYGTRGGNRPPPMGDSGGVPFAPDSPRQGFRVPVMRPGAPPQPTPGPPPRPIPGPRPRPALSAPPQDSGR